MQLPSILGALLSLATLACPATAATVVLWPVDPKIEAGKTATGLWIENKGQEPVTLQIRSLAWTQSDGEDQYADQEDVVASPPIATVPSGERQFVRIIRRAPESDMAERSYRLLIDELPKPLDADHASRAVAQLGVQMRYSIPLFTYTASASGAEPILRTHVEMADGKRYVVISNTGLRHARLVDLRVERGDERTSIIPGLLGYVLPGKTMRWALPDDAPLSHMFQLNINGVDHSFTPMA